MGEQGTVALLVLLVLEQCWGTHEHEAAKDARC